MRSSVSVYFVEKTTMRVRARGKGRDRGGARRRASRGHGANARNSPSSDHRARGTSPSRQSPRSVPRGTLPTRNVPPAQGRWRCRTPCAPTRARSRAPHCFAAGTLASPIMAPTAKCSKRVCMEVRPPLAIWRARRPSSPPASAGPRAAPRSGPRPLSAVRARRTSESARSNPRSGSPSTVRCRGRTP